MKAEDFKAVPVEDRKNRCLGCCFHIDVLCTLQKKDELNSLLMERDGDCYDKKRFIYKPTTKQPIPLDQAKQIVKDRIKELRDKDSLPKFAGLEVTRSDIKIKELELILTKLEEIK